jgi:TIR domain-containing protein
MAHDVFISYSKGDKTVADAACAHLEAAGIRCWIAPRDVVPGKSWAGAIVEGIQTARVMVLVFSDGANKSPQILREVERAVNASVVVVPFRIEDVVPSGDLEYFLSAHHWLDAMTPPLNQHVGRLVQTVERLLGQEASGFITTQSANPADLISKLSQRLLATDDHTELSRILFQARSLADADPDNYEAQQLVEKAQQATRWKTEVQLSQEAPGLARSQTKLPIRWGCSILVLGLLGWLIIRLLQ